MSRVYSPLRYPGGKTCIFPFISSILSENGIAGCKYVEPYAGGAGLALRLLFEEYVESIVINDLDPFVYCFWRVCTQQNERLIQWISETPVTVKTWKRCKEILRHKEETTEFELATTFFFLNRTNVSGVLNGGIIGGLDQLGKYKIDARYNKPELLRRIEKIGRYKSRIEVSRLDGIKLLSRYTSFGAGSVFIYIDPPYYEKGSNLYMNYYNDQDHERLSMKLRKLKKPWVLSYDNHEFIVNLYNKYEKRLYRLQHSTSNRIGNEVVVFSPVLSFQKSIEKLNDAVAI